MQPPLSEGDDLIYLYTYSWRTPTSASRHCIHPVGHGCWPSYSYLSLVRNKVYTDLTLTGRNSIGGLSNGDLGSRWIGSLRCMSCFLPMPCLLRHSSSPI